MAQLFVTSRLLNTLTTGPNHENWMTVGERTPILKLLNSRIISWLILLFSLRRLVSIILLTQKLLLWTKHMENSNYTLCGNSIQFNLEAKKRHLTVKPDFRIFVPVCNLNQALQWNFVSTTHFTKTNNSRHYNELLYLTTLHTDHILRSKISWLPLGHYIKNMKQTKLQLQKATH